jgi:hypothetical protein
MATVSPPAVNITYNQLLSILPSYLERPDAAFAEQIPVFINLAENRLATDMKQEGFLAVVTSQLPLKNSMPKPSFWRETESFSINVAGQLKPVYLRTLEFLKTAFPSVAATGVPQFYADYNATNFYLAPTPDQAYPMELVYYARLDPLSPSNQDNWLTLNAPQALVFACLWEAAMWVKNAAAEQRWMQQYQIAVGGQMTEDTERKLDRNSKNG